MSVALPISDDPTVLRKTLRRFFYKPYLIYKCTLCSRKMNTFSVEHWLQHDAESHHRLFAADPGNAVNAATPITYQHVVVERLPPSSSSASSSSTTTTATTGSVIFFVKTTFYLFRRWQKNTHFCHRSNISNIILLILLLYFHVKTMAEIDLHFNRSCSSHLNNKKCAFWHPSS